jgi:hypothetical protein
MRLTNREKEKAGFKKRTRSQIIGNDKKKGSPTKTCHQLPSFPGTLSKSASIGEVPRANGRNIAIAAVAHTKSIRIFTPRGKNLLEVWGIKLAFGGITQLEKYRN